MNCPLRLNKPQEVSGNYAASLPSSGVRGNTLPRIVSNTDPVLFLTKSDFNSLIGYFLLDDAIHTGTLQNTLRVGHKIQPRSVKVNDYADKLHKGHIKRPLLVSDV